MPDQRTTTQSLQALTRGDARASQELAPAIYEELKALAGWYMRQERPDHTLQSTALLNEAYIRLFDQKELDWKNKTHFKAVAAEMMRRILVDHARRRAADKRGGNRIRVALENAPEAGALEQNLDILALEEGLAALHELHQRQARVVELRFYGGLSVEETAEILDVSKRTVHNDWDFARLWLRQRLTR